MKSEGLHSFATMGLKRSIFFAAAIAVASLLPGQAAHSQVALQKAQNVRLSGESLFRELPTGSIKSRGWINDQLQTSLRALAGQQHRFYPLVRDGTFTGGNVTYSTLNEAQPYYWSAAVAAVATTSSPDLQVWVDAMLDYVVGHQRPDGFFGPDPYIAWPRWLFLDGAKHYCEAFPLKCPEIVDFMVRCTVLFVQDTLAYTRDTLYHFCSTNMSITRTRSSKRATQRQQDLKSGLAYERPPMCICFNGYLSIIRGMRTLNRCSLKI